MKMAKKKSGKRKTGKRKTTKQKDQENIFNWLQKSWIEAFEKAQKKPSLRKALVRQVVLKEKGQLKKYAIEKMLGEPLED